MNIVVLGGAGDMGSHIVQSLIAYSDAQVTIADFEVSKARTLAQSLGERAEAIFVDANNRDSLLLALRGADVAIGAVGPFYRFAPKMAWAALESEIDYVDICDDHGPIDVLFEFDAVARNVGVTLITGLGWTPGLSNVLARHGANQLDQVDEIRIAWIGSGADAQGLAVVKHVLHAVSGEVPTYRDGQWLKVPALSEPERVEFPEPLGEAEVFHVGHPEPLTIPKSIPVKAVSLKGALTPAWNNRLAALVVRLGLTSSARRIDFASRLIHRLEGVISAGGVALSGIRVDVSGTRQGQQVTLTYRAADEMSRLTGLPAAIGAIMLARGEIEGPGVFAPEAIVDPVPFLDALAEHGIEIIEDETVTPAAVERQVPAEVGAPVEDMPAVSPLPSARLNGGRVVEVTLEVGRSRQRETARDPVSDRVPAGTLRASEVVEVALALDTDRSAEDTASPARPHSVYQS